MRQIWVAYADRGMFSSSAWLSLTARVCASGALLCRQHNHLTLFDRFMFLLFLFVLCVLLQHSVHASFLMAKNGRSIQNKIAH